MTLCVYGTVLVQPDHGCEADKYYGNQLRYPLDSDLSGG